VKSFAQTGAASIDFQSALAGRLVQASAVIWAHLMSVIRQAKGQFDSFTRLMIQAVTMEMFFKPLFCRFEGLQSV
jgi:hypothetical protein